MPLDQKLRRPAGVAGHVAILLAAFVLAGWAGLRAISATANTSLPMAPAPAVCIALLGLALWLQQRNRDGVAWTGCAVAALVLAVAILTERIFHLPLRMHGWFAREYS